MAKFLLIGDPHVTADELDDCIKLRNCIHDAINRFGPDYLVFMGDQAHNHAVLNVHVLNYWKTTFELFKPMVKGIISLVGNHDLPGNTGTTAINSMTTLDHLCMVIDESMVFENVLFIGYQHDHKKFKEICHKNNDIKTVFCHQTFQGASYENGFYAKDGIPLEDLPEEQIYVSGHIHTPQMFANVKYFGAPRWRSVTDGSVRDRALVLWDSELNKAIDSMSTGPYVKQIHSFDVTPTSMPPDYTRQKLGDLVYVNVIGPLEWMNALVKPGDAERQHGIITKFFPTDTKVAKVKESEGIDQALMKYVDSLNTTTPKEVLKKMIEERVWNRR